jgi:ribonuclease III
MRGRQIGLDHFINPNPSQKGSVSDGLVADTVEALIGAVNMDGGSWALDEVMKRLGVL